MNYLREINAFYDWLETNSISDSAIVLWHALMHINNKTGWVTEFAVAVSTLETKTGLKKDAIFRARHKLQQVGRIDFRSRSGQQSALYSIKPFESCVVLTDTNSDTKCDTNRNTNRAQTATQSASINKLNKTKQKDKTPLTPQKENYAEFVTLTNAEHKALMERLGNKERVMRCIEILDNYKGANGKKYKSDYRAILNWVIGRLEEEEKKPRGHPPGDLSTAEQERKRELVKKLYLA